MKVLKVEFSDWKEYRKFWALLGINNNIDNYPIAYIWIRKGILNAGGINFRDNIKQLEEIFYQLYPQNTLYLLNARQKRKIIDQFLPSMTKLESFIPFI